MALVTIIGILAIIIALPLIWYVIYLAKGPREEQPRDDTIIDNKFMTQYTNGYGTLLGSFKKGMNRTAVIARPHDINWLEYFEGNGYKTPEIKPIKFWLPEEKIIHFPRGKGPEHRNHAFLEPLRPDMIDEEMLKTHYGQMLAKEVVRKNIEISDKNFMVQELEKKTNILQSQFVGEATIPALTHISELAEEKVKVGMKVGKDGSSKFETPSYGNN